MKQEKVERIGVNEINTTDKVRKNPLIAILSLTHSSLLVTIEHHKLLECVVTQALCAYAVCIY